MKRLVIGSNGNEDIAAVVLAGNEGALVRLCGVSMIDRCLRTLERLGFRSAFVVSATPRVRAELETPSWARGKVALNFTAEIPPSTERLLVIPGDIYCDSRILLALIRCPNPTS